MKCVVVRSVGGPENLEYIDLPRPEAGPGEVLIRVKAAGVNFSDIITRSGRYADMMTYPVVLGMEVAGDVVAVGPDVNDIAIGNRVVANTETGGYAEFVSARASNVMPLPSHASYSEGSSFLINFLTAYIPLSRQVRIGPASSVLVHAAAGGVGSAAVQIARHFGAKVLATSSSDEKLRMVDSLGAAVTINYAANDFTQAVREATGGAGVDVVVDPVGGHIFEKSLTVLKPLGNLISIGFGGGDLNKLDPSILVGNSIGVCGIYLGGLFLSNPQLVRQAYNELTALWEKGTIRPIIGAEFPLSEAAAAHSLIESRKSVGKVVMVP